MIEILLDSSTTMLAVGIAADNRIIDTVFYEAWQKQSEKMVPELVNLLHKHGYTKNDIDGVIVGIGPGSYTGVRIAVTIAKVIGVALNVKLYPISSLALLKCANKKSICLINARSQRSYVGVYEGSKTIVADQIMINSDVLDYINKNPGIVICGDTSYLGIKGYQTNIFEEMLSLRNIAVDVLEVNPIYMKD